MCHVSGSFIGSALALPTLPLLDFTLCCSCPTGHKKKWPHSTAAALEIQIIKERRRCFLLKASSCEQKRGAWGFSWRSTGFNGFTWSVSEFAFTLEFNMQEWAVAPPRREHFAAGRKQHILQDVLNCVLFYLFILFYFFAPACYFYIGSGNFSGRCAPPTPPSSAQWIWERHHYFIPKIFSRFASESGPHQPSTNLLHTNSSSTSFFSFFFQDFNCEISWN